MSADEEEPREGWMKPRSDGMGPGGSWSCSEGPSAGVHGLLLPGRGVRWCKGPPRGEEIPRLRWISRSQPGSEGSVWEARAAGPCGAAAGESLGEGPGLEMHLER